MPSNGAYTFHRVCEIFPETDAEELQDLAEDIKANGQQLPIIVFGNQIYDGRRRFKACELAGVTPKIQIRKTEPSISEIVSLNLKRRDLSASQRAAIGAELLPMLQAEAEKRDQATRFKSGAKNPKSRLSNGRGNFTPPVKPETNDEEKGRSAEIAAEAVGVSDRTLKDAAIVKENNPELFEQVKAGDISASAAAKQVKEEQREEEPAKWKPKKDKYGTAIPKFLEDSFSFDEQFRQALDLHLPGCGKAILELGRAKILKSQVVEVCRNSLAMVATKLKQARPYRICKDCEGAGCKKCGQHGYFTQPTAQNK